MKKLIFIILGLFSMPSLQASHVVGSEISYRYIGDSTGVAHQYLLRLLIYKEDVTYLGNPGTICISSSCFGSTSVILPQIYPPGPNPLAANNSCKTIVDSLSYGTSIMTYIFQDTVVLPGKCGDFRFSYEACCRPSNMTNLSSGSQSMVTDALLNNLLRPNSSPRFKREGIGYFCSNTNRPVQWEHESNESDGDSLLFSFDFQQSNYQLNCNYNGKTTIALKTPFTSNHPFASITPIQINPTNGTITFQPLNEQMALVKFRVEEYTFDTILAMWLKVGEVSREAILFVSNHCSNPANDWHPLPPVDSLQSGSVIASCGDSTILVRSPYKFLSSSLASDGSDFRMVNSQNQLMPIIGARPLNNADTANLIELEVFNGFSYNDSFKLFLRTGSDGNTLLSPCGFEAQGGDSLLVVVSDCNSTNLSEAGTPLSAIFPNPADDYIILERRSVREELWLEVRDQRGTLILHKRLSEEASQRVELGQLPAGSYLLLLKSQGGQPLQRQAFYKL